MLILVKLDAADFMAGSYNPVSQETNNEAFLAIHLGFFPSSEELAQTMLRRNHLVYKKGIFYVLVSTQGYLPCLSS
jgi:hypothetical protein